MRDRGKVGAGTILIRWMAPNESGRMPTTPVLVRLASGIPHLTGIQNDGKMSGAAPILFSAFRG